MSNDTIYRQAAIDAVAEGLKHTFVEYKDIAEKMLNKLPSAQTWIPVTERLPERNGVYLVTVVNFRNEWRLVDDAGHINGEWYTDDGEVYSEWNKGFCIVAWLPQPEPYKGADA